MEADEEILEDGELSNDSDTGYTPLERPANYSITQPNSRFPTIQDSDSEPEWQSSDSDSDSDCKAKRVKRPKIKLKPRVQAQENKRKRYDIWSTRVQDEVLAATLNSCDVTKKDRSRSVESYDYLSHTRKRNRDDRNNSNLKSQGRADDDEDVKGAPRNILDLNETCKSCSADLAKDIANKLNEDKEDLIKRVIETIGIDKTVSIYQETQKVESEGGVMIMNQTRRRTPGGVFLYLVRQHPHLTYDQKRGIFDEEKQKSKTIVKHKQRRKLQKWKEEMENCHNKLLPDLLTRAELLAQESNRTRKETDDGDVVNNPPPTPETDNHDNSTDGMDPINGPTFPETTRKIETYDDDFLDLGVSNNDMDLF